MSPRIITVCSIVCASGCPQDEVPDAPLAPNDQRWEEFLDSREDHLHALAVPIADCVPRIDVPEHPTFAGCWDWHSAVHATWSLFVVTRLTGDAAHAQIARDMLASGDLDAETSRLDAGGLDVEVPYGMAWALLLVSEARDHGEDTLTAFGSAAAARLAEYVDGLGETTIPYLLEQEDYQNLSWALLQLLRWYEHLGDDASAEALRSRIGGPILASDWDCDLEDEATAVTEFFPACLHLARLAIVSLPRDDAEALIESILPAPYELPPVTTPATPHAAGLDFSRAWGLYELYRFTGREDLRDAYREHVETWMDSPAYWAENYPNYSHWVAQFGVHAVAMSYEEGTPWE